MSDDHGLAASHAATEGLPMTTTDENDLRPLLAALLAVEANGASQGLLGVLGGLACVDSYFLALATDALEAGDATECDLFAAFRRRVTAAYAVIESAANLEATMRLAAAPVAGNA